MMSVAPGEGSAMAQHTPHPPARRGLETQPPGLVGSPLDSNYARTSVLLEAANMKHSSSVATESVLGGDMRATPGARSVRAQMDSIRGGGRSGGGDEDEGTPQQRFRSGGAGGSSAMNLFGGLGKAKKKTPSSPGGLLGKLFGGGGAAGADGCPTHGELFSRSQTAKQRRREKESSHEDEMNALSLDHMRLLYLLSLHTGDEGSNQWMRALPLHVFVYELIESAVLSWRHAPTVVSIAWTQHFFNMSQDACTAIEEMHHLGLIRATQLRTDVHRAACSHTTVYQVTPRALQLLKDTLTELDIKAVNGSVCHSGKNTPLHARWSSMSERFFLCREYELDKEGDSEEESGQPSAATDMESLSFVTSPYVPTAARQAVDVKLTDNRDRVVEISSAALGHAADEKVTLNGNVRVMLGEWVPTVDSNQVDTISEALYSRRGGHADVMCTYALDAESENMRRWTGPIKHPTASRLLDCDPGTCVNFEAEIFGVKDSTQVHHVGVHIRHDGFVSYGVRLDAVMDRVGRDVSCELLARVLVDTTTDSAAMLQNVVTPDQQSMLKFVWKGTQLRKQVVVMCDRLSHNGNVAGLLDRGGAESELRSVLGDLQQLVDLSGGEALIIGKEGIMIAGSEVQRHEKVAVAYLSLMARSNLLRNQHRRIGMLNDELRLTRRALDVHETEPRTIEIVRGMLSKISEEIANVTTVMELMQHSDEQQQDPSLRTDVATNLGGVGSARLVEALRLGALEARTKRCAHDMAVQLRAADKELQHLSSIAQEIATDHASRETLQSQSNAAHLASIAAAAERSNAQMKLLQYVLAALLAFQLLDRTGGWRGGAMAGRGNAHSESGVEQKAWASGVLDTLSEQPVVWLAVSLGAWALVALAIGIILKRVTNVEGTPVMLRMTLNRGLDRVKWAEFIAQQPVHSEHAECGGAGEAIRVKTYTWREKDRDQWFGQAPHILMEVDEVNRFLLRATLRVDDCGVGAKQRLDAESLRDLFMSGLEDAGIFADSGSSAAASGGGSKASRGWGRARGPLANAMLELTTSRNTARSDGEIGTLIPGSAAQTPW